MSKRQREKKLNKKHYILVSEDAVSESLLKVIQVKKRLEEDSSLSVNSACNEVGISRSAYYKYRENVFRYKKESIEKLYQYRALVVFGPSFLESFSGVLADFNAEVQQFSQVLTHMEQSMISFTVSLINKSSAKDFFGELKKIREVKKIELHTPFDVS